MNQLLANPWLVQIAAFGLIAAITWLAIEWLTGNSSRAEQRLEDFRDPAGRKKRADGITKGDNLSRMLEAASPALAKPLQPKTEAERNKLKDKLSYAGFRGEGAPMVFQASKFLLLLIGLFFGGGASILVYGLSQAALFRIVIIAGGSFYLPELVIMYLAKKRKESIFLSFSLAIMLSASRVLANGPTTSLLVWPQRAVKAEERSSSPPASRLIRRQSKASAPVSRPVAT